MHFKVSFLSQNILGHTTPDTSGKYLNEPLEMIMIFSNNYFSRIFEKSKKNASQELHVDHCKYIGFCLNLLSKYTYLHFSFTLYLRYLPPWQISAKNMDFCCSYRRAIRFFCILIIHRIDNFELCMMLMYFFFTAMWMSYLCIFSNLYCSVKKKYKLLFTTLLDYMDSKKTNIGDLCMDIYK